MITEWIIVHILTNVLVLLERGGGGKIFIFQTKLI